MFVLHLRTESKSVHHRHLVKHLFIFANQVLGVELRPQPLNQVFGERVVNVFFLWLVCLEFGLGVYLPED